MKREFKSFGQYEAYYFPETVRKRRLEIEDPSELARRLVKESFEKIRSKRKRKKEPAALSG